MDFEKLRAPAVEKNIRTSSRNVIYYENEGSHVSRKIDYMKRKSQQAPQSMVRAPTNLSVSRADIEDMFG